MNRFVLYQHSTKNPVVTGGTIGMLVRGDAPGMAYLFFS